MQCKQQGGDGACVAEVGMAQQFIKLGDFPVNYLEFLGFVSLQLAVGGSERLFAGMTIPFGSESS